VKENTFKDKFTKPELKGLKKERTQNLKELKERTQKNDC
jgi:hypothetical protein